MHEAGFAHWPGQIAPQTRSYEVVSSLDVVPTVSAVIGAALPTDRVYDGRDMSDVIFDRNNGKSKHDVRWPRVACLAHVHTQAVAVVRRACEQAHVGRAADCPVPS